MYIDKTSEKYDKWNSMGWPSSGNQFYNIKPGVFGVTIDLLYAILIWIFYNISMTETNKLMPEYSNCIIKIILWSCLNFEQDNFILKLPFFSNILVCFSY